jgi:putative transposase
LSRDLRDRIVEAVEGGSSMRGATARFAVSPSSAIKLMARVRATGSVAPARYGGHRRPLLASCEDVLRAPVADQPEGMLRKAAARTKEAVWATAGQLLNLILPSQCRNYLANSGYEPT